MKTILILKHFEKKTYSVKFFKNEDEAIKWWNTFPDTMKWEVVHIGDNEDVCSYIYLRPKI